MHSALQFIKRFCMFYFIWSSQHSWEVSSQNILMLNLQREKQAWRDEWLTWPGSKASKQWRQIWTPVTPLPYSETGVAVNSSTSRVCLGCLRLFHASYPPTQCLAHIRQNAGLLVEIRAPSMREKVRRGRHFPAFIFLEDPDDSLVYFVLVWHRIVPKYLLVGNVSFPSSLG